MTYLTRGFSTIEILIALTVMTMVVVAVAQVSFDLPKTLGSMELERLALIEVRDALAVLEREVANAYSDKSTLIGTSTKSGMLVSRTIDGLENESFSRVKTTASWRNLFGVIQERSLESYVGDSREMETACDPFVSGDWSAPAKIARYQLNGAGLLTPGTQGAFSISDLEASPSSLVVAAGSTSLSRLPSILFFSTRGTSTPMYTGGFDNASTSRIGFSSVAIGKDYVFAGNAFQSASASTCSDGISCSHVQVFSRTSLARAGFLTLATASPPHAYTSAGAPSPVSAVTYYNDYLYVGLTKTAQGSEFNIVDAHNPLHLRWVSGYRIGRTVNSITVRGTYAYVSTDDPTRELMVFDVRNPSDIRVAGVWDAPGSQAFGYGARATVHTKQLRFGRTYSANAPEFSLLDISELSAIKAVESVDFGTTRDTQSVRDILTQEQLTFSLLTRRLEIWDTSDPERVTQYTPAHVLPTGSSAVALTCRHNLLYIAHNDQGGSGSIDVLSGS